MASRASLVSVSSNVSARLVVALLSFAGLGPGLGACAKPAGGGDNSGSGGDGGGNQTSGGGGNNPTGGGGSGASTGAGGAGARDGGSPAEVGDGCTNSDKTIMPMDSTGWIPRACTNYQIQGAWYCYSDGMGSTDCVTGKVPFMSGSGMCISGTTTTNSAGYGAGIGVELNSSGGTTSVKSAYNATMNQIIGFQITITGSAGNVALRLGFTQTNANPPPGPAPFVSLPGPGTYNVLFTDAVVPGGWSSGTAGMRADPTSIYDVQLAVPVNATAVNYNYCISSLKPITAGTSTAPTGACAGYGSMFCGTQDLLGGMGNYAVQNNINMGAPGTQCLQATAGNDCAGFTATLTGFGSNGTTPSSYPSVIYGWQAGSFYGAYQTAKTVTSILNGGSATTSWNFTAPTGGKWDAAYDIWFSPQAAPPTAAGGLELMIWPNYGGMAQPVGTNVLGGNATTTIGGAPYEVWTGTVSTWKYIAYRRQPGSGTAISNMDLKPFFMDAVNRGSLQNAWYLLGIQAGFEIWQGSGTASTTSFSASVK
jgi:cellulose 1,4-beta-cellobiosidase